MKILVHLFRIFSVIYLIGAILFFYFYFIDGRDILRYTNLPFPTDKTAYHSGDIVQITRAGCASRDIRFTVRASIIDGFVLNYSPFDGTRFRGCVEKTGIELHIPDFLPPGKYHIQGITTVYVNPILSRDIPWTTQEFTVVK